MSDSQLRAAVEAHEPPSDGWTQWYVDERCIDCDAREFWAVAAKAETALVKRTLALSYRQQAGWTDDASAIQELLDLANQVEAVDGTEGCCPCCQEVTCDAGCPLEPVRSSPADGQDCQAAHCPPSATQDCDWPRCAGQEP